MPAVYDRIGSGYARFRRPDPRIAARIAAALGHSRSIVNVGAGTGSYEPADRLVVAVEPSEVMVAQRPDTSGPAVRAVAERLPFRAGSFDAATAFVTVHHWPHPEAGLAEMRRVAGRQVVLTFDWAVHNRHWFIAEYLPEIEALTAAHIDVAEVVDALSGATVEPVPVHHDSPDATLVSHWRRPHAYLDAEVRSASSGLSLLPGDVVSSAVDRLRADLATGRWHRRHAHLLDVDAVDVGLRLVVAGS